MVNVVPEDQFRSVDLAQYLGDFPDEVIGRDMVPQDLERLSIGPEAGGSIPNGFHRSLSSVADLTRGPQEALFFRASGRSPSLPVEISDRKDLISTEVPVSRLRRLFAASL
jgi:hypothetical protein